MAAVEGILYRVAPSCATSRVAPEFTAHGKSSHPHNTIHAGKFAAECHPSNQERVQQNIRKMKPTLVMRCRFGKSALHHNSPSAQISFKYSTNSCITRSKLQTGAADRSILLVGPLCMHRRAVRLATHDAGKPHRKGNWRLQRSASFHQVIKHGIRPETTNRVIARVLLC